MGVECPKCHSENTDTARFCSNCATPLSPSKEIPASPTKTLETPTKELTRGSTFAGRYEIIEELGKGGMGKVYRVEDKKIKEEVALKLIKPEIASDKKTIERFSNELKMARKIAHRNVCRMHDLNEAEGTHYITMEYVDGENLRSFIRRVGQLPVGKSISITRQVCEGLAEAHRLGIIHRDLKPSNIMIDREGNAKIMDFGIARSLRAQRLTGTGVMIGTPEYMSPEQAEAKEVDGRSDIYSLGVILYEMLTGRLPFEGDTPLAVAMKHKSEVPQEPRKLNPQIPEDISRLILKCLEKRKEDRYPSPDKIIHELKKFKDEKTEVPGKKKQLRLFPFKLARKKAKPKGIKKRIARYSLRALISLVIIYVIISVIGLINDAIYKGEIEKVRVEHDTYYKNLFPVQKDWLPPEWITRDANACNVYLKLFPPRADEEGKLIPKEEYQKNEYIESILKNPPLEELKKFFDNFGYDNTQELKSFLDKYEEYYKFDELFNAGRCSRLNPYKMLVENNRFYYFPLVQKYTRMILLKARVDFLEGNRQEGLMKIYKMMIFITDMMQSSHSIIEDLFVVLNLKWLSRELITLIISGELDYQHNTIQQLEKLISMPLETMNPESSYYKDYLGFGKVKATFFKRKRVNYFLLGKLAYWKNGFSALNFLNTWIKFYQNLFEDIKYIRNSRDKSIYIRDHFMKNSPMGPGTKLGVLPSFAFRLNIARMFGKLTLILLTIQKYGLNSPEFLDLKGTDVFINEFSGKKFEIIEEEGETFIVLDEDFKLNLKRINYKEDHKTILQSFTHFDVSTEEQFRSIFYSFALE